MVARTHYPLFADLTGRRVVVAGGGLIAQRKVAQLLRCGAQVTVVSPGITARLAAWARQGRVRHVARRCRPGDVRSVWLAIAATDDPRVNAQVSRAARRARVFANVVDRPALCSFIAPAILRRGPLTVAVSSGGASPTVAQRVRREVARVVGPEYGRLAHLLAGLRASAKRRLPTFGERKRYFARVAGGRVVRLVRSGRMRAARREAQRLLEVASG